MLQPLPGCWEVGKSAADQLSQERIARDDALCCCLQAHFLKNGEAQITQAVSGLPAQRRLLMSGTPIQNDLSEFHAVFDLACPGLLGTLNSFRKTYEGPIQRGRDSDATDKQVCKACSKTAVQLCAPRCGTCLLAKCETCTHSAGPSSRGFCLGRCCTELLHVLRQHSLLECGCLPCHCHVGGAGHAANERADEDLQPLHAATHQHSAQGAAATQSGTGEYLLHVPMNAMFVHGAPQQS